MFPRILIVEPPPDVTEPSFRQLFQHVDVFRQNYIDSNTDTSIMDSYYEEYEYLLFGSLKMNWDQPITYAKIMEAVNKTCSLQSCCNDMDARDVKQRMNDSWYPFHHLMNVLNRYYDVEQTHEDYRPRDLDIPGDKGGKMYQKILANTLMTTDI